MPDGKGGVHKTGHPYKVAGRWYKPLQHESAYDASGIASWYGRDFHGKHTANGEIYDMHALSAAHKTLPLPTLVRVTNLDNGRSVIVRVNDRGPFVKNRLIDLSHAAAQQLGYAERGTAHVRVQTLDLPAPNKDTQLATSGQKTGNRLSGPHAAPASVASGNMFIQLGAFGLKDNAIRLQNRLKTDFPNTHATATSLSGKTLYRVRIGPFDDMPHMEEAILSLQSRGFEKPMVIIP